MTQASKHLVVALIAIGATGAVLRLAAIFTVGTPPALEGDEIYYVSAARSLASGAGYPDSVRPPGFPAFCALVLRFCRNDLTAVRLAQIPISLLSAGVVFDLARRHFGGRAAVLSGFLCAVDPSLVHYTHFLWSETLVTTLILVAFWFLDSSRDGRQPLFLLLAGVALAIGALTREMVLYLLPLFVLWLWVRDTNRRIVAVAFLVLPAVLIVGSWAVRNYHLHHRFVLISTMRWFPVAVGNVFAAGGRTALVQFREQYDRIDDEFEREELARRVAVQTIRAEQPGWILKKASLNVYELFTTDGQLARFLRLGWLDPAARTTAAALIPVESGFYVMQLVLGLAGLCWVPAPRLKPLVASLIVLFLSIYVVANANHRFRVPFLPWLSLFGGAFLARGIVRDRWLRWRTGAFAAFLLVVAAVLVADWIGVPGVREARLSDAPSRRPSVLLISVDTLRADHLGSYGYERATSPFIDSLARDGVVFENAYSPSSWTLPAHASMLTGASPFVHGATDETRVIRQDVPTVAERLSARGYLTRAIVNAPYVGSHYGFSRGFDRFEEYFHSEVKADVYHAKVLEAVESTLRDRGERPFFLFVHYMDVHSPYDPPPRYNRFVRSPELPVSIDGSHLSELSLRLASGEVTLAPRDRDRLVDLYDGGILSLDATLGELFERIRRELPRDLLVILTADHGEEFLEHGGIVHGRTLYDEVLHVPLIVIAPTLPRGKRFDGLVSTMDVTPTILGFALGEEADATSSLLSLAAGGGTSSHPPILLQTSSHDKSVALRGLRTEASKLIVDDSAGRDEYYDLRNDRAERINRYPAADAAPLEALVAKFELPDSPKRPALDQREIDSLHSLGYVN